MLRIQHLTRTLLFVVLLATMFAACSQPNSSTTSVTSSNSKKLVVYLVGYGEQLSTSDASSNGGYGSEKTFYQPNGIQPYLQAKKGSDGFQDAQSMVFSYAGVFPNTNGKPEDFTCDKTFSNTLLTDEYLLKKQVNAYIKTNPGTKVFLVGHSLGGVIAFAYMADVIETNHLGSNTLDKSGSVLSGVSTNDSPLGGIEKSIFYQRLAGLVSHWRCTPRPSANIVQDMEDIFKSANNNPRLGEAASISQVILSGNPMSNQAVAETAARLGVAIIISGNSYDLMWQPKNCPPYLDANFLSTQYLSEKGNIGRGALYVREFQAGFPSCLNRGLVNNANHFEVVTNNDVKQAIWETFTSQNVTLLKSITNSNTPVGLPTPMPTQAPQSVLIPGTWKGTETSGGGNPFPTQLVLDSVSNGTFTGTWGIPGPGNSAEPLQNGSTYDNRITFSISTQVANVVATFEGTISGNTISGVWHAPDGSGGKFSVTKV
jgi:Lipase (class 3)